MHNFRALLADLSSLAESRTGTASRGPTVFNVLTRLTKLQRSLFELLGVSPSSL